MYLGYEISSVERKIFLPEEKIREIDQSVAGLQTNINVSIRDHGQGFTCAHCRIVFYGDEMRAGICWTSQSIYLLGSKDRWGGGTTILWGCEVSHAKPADCHDQCQFIQVESPPRLQFGPGVLVFNGSPNGFESEGSAGDPESIGGLPIALGGSPSPSSLRQCDSSCVHQQARGNKESIPPVDFRQYYWVGRAEPGLKFSHPLKGGGSQNPLADFLS